jgi:p-aminobenzoyl-glutamate transporter AbgT
LKLNEVNPSIETNVEVHYVMSATSVSIFEDILLHISEYSIFPRLQSQSKTVRGIESQSKSSKLDDKSVENGKFPFLWQFVSMV